MTIPSDPVVRVSRRMEKNWPEAVHPSFTVKLAVRRLGRLLDENVQRILSEDGLTTTEFEVLSVLRSYPAPHKITPSALYDAMLISSGGLTKVLKSLEARALIERSISDTDRRSLPICLTGKGCVLVERLMAAIGQSEAALFEQSLSLQQIQCLEQNLFEVTAKAEMLRHPDQGENQDGI